MTTDSNLKAALEASLGAEYNNEFNRTARGIWQSFRDKSGYGWPSPEKFRYVSLPAGGRGYESDYFEGAKPGVTSVLKVLGLGTEGLIKWSANEERKAVLGAASLAFDDVSSWRKAMVANPALPPLANPEYNGSNFVQAIETRLGPARAHQRLLAKSADIGTEAHQAVQNWLQAQISGLPDPDCKGMRDEALMALMGFQDWFRASGLKPVRCEQPVFSESFAGTIDVVCEHPRFGLGVVDLKTGKGIYDEYHLQVSAYIEAGMNFADLKWAKILRLPKYLSDPAFEVRALGDLYGGRTLSQDQLFEVFSSCLRIWQLMVS